MGLRLVLWIAIVSTGEEYGKNYTSCNSRTDGGRGKGTMTLSSDVTTIYYDTMKDRGRQGKTVCEGVMRGEVTL